MHETNTLLSPRLAHIVPMLAEGLTNAEIADRLVVTVHTAEKYVSELKLWYGARDRVDLVLRCMAEVGESAPQVTHALATAVPPTNGIVANADDQPRTWMRHWQHQGLTVVAAALGICAGFVVAADLLVRPYDGSFEVPAGEAERLGGGTHQQVALADGKVTPTEYSAAYQRMLDCFDEADIPYVVSTDWRGAPQYSVGPFDSKATLDAAKVVTEACYAEHFRGAEVALAAAER